MVLFHVNCGVRPVALLTTSGNKASHGPLAVQIYPLLAMHFSPQ